MAKRMILMLLLAAVVLGGIFGFEAFKSNAIKKFLAASGNPAQTVSTVEAKLAEWQPRLEAVGSLRAVSGADLSAQVAGIVSAIHFQSGADVKQGTLLLELMAADDIAKLQSLKATAALAKITLERDQKQLAAQAVSQQTVDTDTQTLKSDEAQVAQQQALVDYKSIRAPFSGRLGIRQVDLGQYLAAGTAIVTLQSLDPIYIDFYLPQQALAQIKVGQPVSATVDTYPRTVFPGEIAAVNPKVDPATRNVQARAVLKNPELKLLPGMFATVRVEVGTPESHLTLPQTAITYNSYGSTVYIVEQKGKNAKGEPMLAARQTFVTTGETRGDQVAVLSGLKAGETVVSAGGIKLHNGSPVIVNNSVQPSDNPNPSPADE
ncbi:MAG TPA: efflux RND transporter periplasmic adaptor subunit [Alphaproteobacteria bacterium]|nr:efflux RND transporter periplasmic adaptor subunit [Alphaproteobacteria bacterium]